MVTIAMIPARIGSTRLKMKNLAIINGKPLIYYAIEAAKKSKVFDRIVINSDNEVFGNIAKRYGVEFYNRPEHLGSSITKSDDVVEDFIKNHPSDITVWVNPISPLQTGEEIKGVVEYFMQQKLDSLITVNDEQVHCIYQGKPINFVENSKFSQTQDLEPIQTLIYSIMMWNSKVFTKAIRRDGHAILCGKVGYATVSKLSGMIIKTEQDLRLAECVIQSRACKKPISYDELADISYL